MGTVSWLSHVLYSCVKSRVFKDFKSYAQLYTFMYMSLSIVSTTLVFQIVWHIDMKFDTNIHGSQVMHPTSSLFSVVGRFIFVKYISIITWNVMKFGWSCQNFLPTQSPDLFFVCLTKLNTCKTNDHPQLCSVYFAK